MQGERLSGTGSATINCGPPLEDRIRYEALVEKRRAETLTSEEHAELLEMTESLEALQVERAQALAQLARLRGVSVSELMAQLGIRAPEHA